MKKKTLLSYLKKQPHTPPIKKNKNKKKSLKSYVCTPAKGNGKSDGILLRADDKLAQILTNCCQTYFFLHPPPAPNQQFISQVFLQTSFSNSNSEPQIKAHIPPP